MDPVRGSGPIRNVLRTSMFRRIPAVCANGSFVASRARGGRMVSSNLMQWRPECVELGGGRQLRLLDVIGKGGFATVLRGLLVMANGVQRSVAVKLFSAVSSDEADQVRT